MTPIKAIGKVIVEQRTRQGRNQKQFAKAAQLSVHQLDKIENGEQRTVGLKVLRRIAAAFGLRLSEFIFLVEQHLPKPKKRP
jgi:transcriptional regulator with XRE-family HTH domain